EGETAARRKTLPDTPEAEGAERPTRGTDEDVRPQMESPADVTDTAAFKRWSKGAPVLDANTVASGTVKTGEPAVVRAFHSVFFDEREDGVPVIGPEGFHFGTKAAADERSAGKPVDDFIRSIVVEEAENEDGKTQWYWSADGVDSYDLHDGNGF